MSREKAHTGKQTEARWAETHTAMLLDQRSRTARGARFDGPSRIGYAALHSTGCVQCMQRRASMGISLRHSGHFLVVGSGGRSPRFIRATSAFTGVTTKK